MKYIIEKRNYLQRFWNLQFEELEFIENEFEMKISPSALFGLSESIDTSSSSL